MSIKKEERKGIYLVFIKIDTQNKHRDPSGTKQHFAMKFFHSDENSDPQNT